MADRMRHVFSSLNEGEATQFAQRIADTYRQKVDVAHSLYEQLQALERGQGDGSEVSSARCEYQVAKVLVDLHHELLKAVIVEVGFVPKAIPD